MIEVQDLRIIFGAGTPMETPALRGISLDIPEGQFVTVIGSNGAGKTTLLNALSGEAIPDSGRVLIDSTDVTEWPTFKRAELAARVFQDPMAGSCANLSIVENIGLASARGQKRKLRPATGKALREEARSRLARLELGLEDRLDDPMELLSGGQRQAVSLLMATFNPMKILLLDEHTAALDPKIAAFVIDLTKTIVEEQKLTTLMVTHSMRQALDVGERTVMLHEGQVVLDVSGDERKGLTVEDLLHMFEKVRGEELDDDTLLLG
ncbi:MAG: ABC transporter ATP-binding protein [Rhodospirillales bacterium]|nr:ABC transporter ATP-binding protein [Rhodospirillales bacterium]